MFTASLLVVLLASSASAAVHTIACSDTTVKGADTQMWKLPDNCGNKTVKLMIKPLTADTDMALLFSDVAFYNESGVSMEAMVILTVMQPMTKDADKYEIIIKCDPTMMTPCMDRASTMPKAMLMFESMTPMGETSSYGVTFTTRAIKKTMLAGFVDCRCRGSSNMNNAGNMGTAMVPIPTDDMTLNITSKMNPCAGTQCMAIFHTTPGYAIKLEPGMTDSIMDMNRTQATLMGKMMDLYSNMENTTSDFQLYVNSSSSMSMPKYSSRFMINLRVDYMSYDMMMKEKMMPQGQSSVQVSAVMMPNMTMMMKPKTLANEDSSTTVSAMVTPYDFPNVVYMWEIDVSMKNKDSNKYTVGMATTSCTGLDSGNMVMIRTMTSNGKIWKTLNSCSAKEMEFMTISNTEMKKIFVEYVRVNASLATGDWSLKFSTFKSSGTTTVASLATLLLAVVAIIR